MLGLCELFLATWCYLAKALQLLIGRMLPALMRPQPQLGVLPNHALESHDIAACNLIRFNLLHAIVYLVEAYGDVSRLNAFNMDKVDGYVKAHGELLATIDECGLATEEVEPLGVCTQVGSLVGD